MGEARACLVLGRAFQAERALKQAAARAPGDSTRWLIRLELIRLENRTLDAKKGRLDGFSSHASRFEARGATLLDPRPRDRTARRPGFATSGSQDQGWPGRLDGSVGAQPLARVRVRPTARPATESRP